MRTSVALGGMFVAAFAGVVGTRYAARAHHGGGPPLHYSGFLSQGGQPVTDPTADLDVLLFAAASGGNALCDSVPGDVPITDGHFTIGLQAACTAAIEANPGLWMEIRVDGAAVGPRTEIGAAPFAIRAGRADVAGSATTLSSPLPATAVSSSGSTVEARLNALGTAVSALQLAAVSSGGATRMEFASLGGACEVLAESGDWIQSTSNPGTGRCELTLVAGTFSALPTCVCTTAYDRNCGFISQPDATHITFGIQTFAGGNITDSLKIVCTGPR